MSRVLVSGGAGFIGSHVVDALIVEGHEVIVLDNLSTGSKDNINPKAKFIKGDIRDMIIWHTLPKCEYVFHLASLARIQPSIEDPITSNNVNVYGTLQVLEYCKLHQAKIIFSGSSSIYAGNTEEAVGEGADKDPKSPYALQKLICEQYIDLYRKLYGLSATILRYFNVYGERQILDGAYAAVVGIFIKQKADGQKLTLTGDGEQRRDFTYVKDVARANVMAMKWEGTFNIGTGKNYSINEIADFVGGEKEYLPKRQGEAMFTLADNHRARHFNWQPTKDIREWINETIG